MSQSRADRTSQCRPARPQGPDVVRKASLILLFFLISLTESHLPAASAAQTRINCRIHDGPCSQILAGFEITLDIQPKPVRAMRKLEFRVLLSGGEPERPLHIDLGMPGMNMGPNRVILERVSPAIYDGVGVIVRCPSGSRTWRATVTVPGRGKAEFFFDVVY